LFSWFFDPKPGNAFSKEDCSSSSRFVQLKMLFGSE